MIWITDRTQADVLLGNSKGYYTWEDLNRVEGAVQELCLLAQELDIHLKPVLKLDWQAPCTFSAESWPVESQLRRYLANVQALCKATAVSVELPVGMENLTWEGANQIERALELTHRQIEIIRMAFRFSGEFFAGEET